MKIDTEESLKNFERLYYKVKTRILILLKEKNIVLDDFLNEVGMSEPTFKEFMTTNHKNFSLYLDMLNKVEGWPV